jgi:hypothetical protein
VTGGHRPRTPTRETDGFIAYLVITEATGRIMP